MLKPFRHAWVALGLAAAFASGRTAAASGRFDFRLPEPAPETRSQSESADVAESRDESQALALLKQAQEAMGRADRARADGRDSDAARSYETALLLYNRLAEEFPGWQSGLVKFRQAFCVAMIEESSGREGIGIAWEAGAWQIGPPEPSPEERDAALSSAEEAGNKDLAAENRLQSLISQARQLIETGRSEEAILPLVDALRLNPSHVHVRLLIGVAQCQSGKHEDALFILNPLVQEHPRHAHAHVAIGTACFGLGRFDEARAALEQALAIDPGLHAAHYNLAQLLLRMKPPDREAARRHYREALRLGGERDKDLEKHL